MQTEQRKHQVLICVECGEEFVFPISAQEYFEEQGFNQSPKRCKTCHSRLKRDRRVAH